MQNLGKIKEIWRYPVKGMAGESLAHCALNESGLYGDRMWALRDVKRQEIQSCKFRPELLMCRARSRSDKNDAHVDITFPCGTTLGSDAPTIHQKLSELVGFESTLERLEPNLDAQFFHRYQGAEEGWLEELKATFTREANEPYPDFSSLPPEVAEFVTVPGSFFLVSPFHIITTASLEYLKQKRPESDWNSERFRPNIIVDTPEGLRGLVEQEWLNQDIQIAELNIECTSAAPRCGAIVRSQQNLPFDKTLLRTVIKEADQNVGIYASVKNEGRIRIGDTVRTSE